MATGKITKTAIDTLHPGERDKLLWDEKLSGFGVKVTPKGKRVFIYQYRLGGRGAKVRRYTIGQYGAFTADAGRKEAERLSRLVAQGVDPQVEKVDRQRKAIDLAFSGYVDRFAAYCLAVKWKASAAEVEAMLRTYAVPVLRDKPLPDIGRSDISTVLRPLKQKSASASKLFAVLRHLFNWAVNEGDLETSPMLAMKAPPVPKSRDRTLGDDELVQVWEATETIGYPFGPFIRLLILLGARRNEVAELPWAELDRQSRTWKLPAERAKNGEATVYPLSDLAFDELEALARAVGKKDAWPKRGYVFSTTGKTTISGFSRAKSRLDAAIANANDGEGLPDWVLHDLRRTLATGMQRLGVRFEVTEAILNHVSGSRAGVAGIYQRHDWAAEKATALQAWSDHIARILAGDNKDNGDKIVQLASVRV